MLAGVPEFAGALFALEELELPLPLFVAATGLVLLRCLFTAGLACEVPVAAGPDFAPEFAGAVPVD